MDERIDKLPAAIRALVTGNAEAANTTVGQGIGNLIDDVLADGWVYDKPHDSFVKGGDRVMVKVVWRALMEARGVG